MIIIQSIEMIVSGMYVVVVILLKKGHHKKNALKVIFGKTHEIRSNKFTFLSIKIFIFTPYSGGETGRRVRLRGVCRKTWEFESPPEYSEAEKATIIS